MNTKVEDVYKTTIIITIEQTVESPDKLPEFHETVRDNKRKRVYDAPKPSSYFHIEYQLLPGQAVYKTDVVTFGVVSKIYTDVDSRVVKTFQEGANISYGWKHTHSLKVNKNTLLDLYDHVFHLRIWDGKHKVSPRARFDQPKAFRLPASKKTSDSDDESFGIHHSNFLKVAQEHCRVSPAKSRVTTEIQLSRATDLSNLSLLTSPSPQKCVTDSDGQEDQSWSKMSVVSRQSPASVSPAKVTKESPLVLKTQASRLAERAREESERNGNVVLSLCMANLFAIKKSLTVEMIEPVKSLVKCRLTISLKSPLMPEKLRRELNPMTITILSANNLPDVPTGYNELQEKCDPAYVSYQFPGHNQTFRTSGQLQASRLVWEQSRVFLLGVVDKMILSEYLRGPPLQLELHDRDRKLKYNNQPMMFGKEREDNILGTTSFVEDRCVKVNPFVDAWKPWDSYGVALCDLSGLLHGETFISSTVAVLAGPRGPEKSSDLLKPPTGEVCEILPTGDYLQCNTELSLEVELTYPLTSYTIPESNESCPFGRIVLMFTYKHKSLVQELLSLVSSINTKALELNDMAEDDALAILSTYKLKREQINSDSLDVVTGFHLMDGVVHIIVLEGLRRHGILHIWENIPRHPSQSMGVVEVLYNSDYAFSERLYGELDVEICCVRLHQPLQQLVQTSQPYVWNKIPCRSFQGLMCINELLQATKLSDAARTNLFPSAAMIQELSMEFAVPALVEELQTKEKKDGNLDSLCELQSPTATAEQSQIMDNNRWTPLDNYNKQYEEHLRLKALQPDTKNHIHNNILKTKALAEASSWKTKRTRSLSDDPRLSRMFEDLSAPRALDDDGDDDKIKGLVHNYSVQTFNSNVFAKKKMQKRLSQEPNARFTYCQQYHFRTVTPVSVEETAKQYDRFVYYPHNTALEDNQHPKDPEAYRKTDLKQPFEDNTLHANKLKPTVDRMQFSWQKRDEDFELYRKPKLDFGSSPPVTIHLAGEQRKKEIDEFKQKDHEDWHSKVVVNQTDITTHRTGIGTELSMRPSCSVDKLKGLLKDEPQKLSLKLPGLRLVDSPAINIVQATEHRPDCNIPDDAGVGYHPGALENHSLKLDKNVIPIADRTHDKFIKLKGQDFRLHYHTQQSITSQPIKLLNKKEPTRQATENKTDNIICYHQC